MKHARFSLVVLFLLSGSAHAQEVTIPANIERLAARAADTVNVTVDGALLRLAARFLSSRDPDQQAVRRLIGNIKGIYVRQFAFDAAGQYTDADVDSLRVQLKAPQWSRMASVRSQREGENVEVYLRMENDQISSLAVIAADPRELTFVNVVGPIDLDGLADLGGHFGIPRVRLLRGK